MHLFMLRDVRLVYNRGLIWVDLRWIFLHMSFGKCIYSFFSYIHLGVDFLYQIGCTFSFNRYLSFSFLVIYQAGRLQKWRLVLLLLKESQDKMVTLFLPFLLSFLSLIFFLPTTSSPHLTILFVFSSPPLPVSLQITYSCDLLPDLGKLWKKILFSLHQQLPN